MLRSSMRGIVAWRQPIFACRMSSTSKAASLDGVPGALRREKDQHDINNLDIIEERIRRRQTSREIIVGGQTQRWNYRSEVVGKLGLDNNHKNIWVTYALIIIFGFGSFVYVKSNVVLSRQEEMQERERIRRSMNLLGSDRKKIAVVDTD